MPSFETKREVWWPHAARQDCRLEQAEKRGKTRKLTTDSHTTINGPYRLPPDYFPEYAETINGQAGEGGESTRMLHEVSKEMRKWLIGGSIPERDEAGKLYNTWLSRSLPSIDYSRRIRRMPTEEQSSDPHTHTQHRLESRGKDGDKVPQDAPLRHRYSR